MTGVHHFIQYEGGMETFQWEFITVTLLVNVKHLGLPITNANKNGVLLSGRSSEIPYFLDYRSLWSKVASVKKMHHK